MSDKSYMGLTRDGTPWEPQFVTALDQNACIGCGRCYKVCPRDVFDLVEKEMTVMLPRLLPEALILLCWEVC